MIKNFKNKKGFTLVELLIAMMIFVVFITILMGSYTRLVQAQREANDYRILYSEARTVFDRISDELKNGTIYYGRNPVDDTYKFAKNEIRLVSQDGSYIVLFKEIDNAVGYCRATVGQATQNDYVLTPQTVVKQFDIYVSPAGDPYKAVNVQFDSLQFQPKVTVDAIFAKDIANEEFTLPLRTTVSSRFYSVSPYDKPTGDADILSAFTKCEAQLLSLKVTNE